MKIEISLYKRCTLWIQAMLDVFIHCVILLFQGKGKSADKADIIFQPEKFCHSGSLFGII